MEFLITSFAWAVGLVWMPFLSRAIGWFDRWRSNGWTEVEGRIEGGQVIRRSGSEFRAEISYSYKAEGDFFSGHFQHWWNDEQRAWDFLAGWRDRGALIRYHPRRHENSVLLRALN